MSRRERQGGRMIFNLMKPVPVADVEPDEPTATMYSYNGIVLPALPKWDKTAYPYAQIRKRKLYLSSSPITYNTSTWKYAYSAPYLLANFTYSADVICWGEVTENETQPTGYEDTLWSNHNILDENGNVHFEASVPVPISLPFTLFDGEITTTKPDYSEYSYGRTYELLYGYKSGDTLRITFDGETKEYSGATLQTNISNGGDFGIHALQPWSIWKWYAEIETKTAGTHTLKIELIGVKELVGYSYNGTVLPPLPEWDKEQYPYAVITKYLAIGKLFGYDIVVSNRPLFMTKSEPPHLWQPSGTNSSITMSAKLYLDRTVDDTPPGEWGKWGSPYDSYGPGARWWDEPIWANYDVELCDGLLNPMGETALSASEPIPIYE
jgi:hypothetical protein